jgi:hypothetical protein
VKRVSATGEALVFSFGGDAALIVGLSKNGSVTDAEHPGDGRERAFFRFLVPDSWFLTSVTDRVCSHERIPVSCAHQIRAGQAWVSTTDI